MSRFLNSQLSRFLISRININDVKGSNSVKYISNTRNRMVKIYTKTGDAGNSSLYTGERRPKTDDIFEALGTTDELSSCIAVAKEHGTKGNHSYVERLSRIQCVLQDLGSLVATPTSSAREAHLKNVEFPESYSTELEEWIDEYTATLPELTNFILPGGGEASASLHVARTVCRRAERRVTPLVRSGQVNGQALVYLNRLSDFLFTAARLAAKLDNREEAIYMRPTQNPKAKSKDHTKKK